jgi:membrane-bound metal-dependent hydrolase YbcI (DUF457 family)
MITRHHITLAALCSLVLISAGFPGPLLPAAVLVAGTGTGAILPDIHMKKPSRLRFLTGAYYLTRFSEQAGLFVLKFLYRTFLAVPVADRDKRLAHSLPGAAAIFVTLAAISRAACSLAGVPGGVAEIFPAGLALGLAFHLLTDMCTKKGVMPLFPFCMTQVSGTIRPCNTEDPRIAWYHCMLCLALAGVMALAPLTGHAGPLLVGIATGSLMISTVLMLYTSRVHLAGDTPSGSPVPEPSGPVTE